MAPKITPGAAATGNTMPGIVSKHKELYKSKGAVGPFTVTISQRIWTFSGQGFTMRSRAARLCGDSDGWRFRRSAKSPSARSSMWRFRRVAIQTVSEVAFDEVVYVAIQMGGDSDGQRSRRRPDRYVAIQTGWRLRQFQISIAFLYNSIIAYRIPIQSPYVFPLRKCSDIKKIRLRRFSLCTVR